MRKQEVGFTKTIIVNGTLMLPQECAGQELLIDEGAIAAIGQGLSRENCRVFDAEGGLVLPGFIDAHTHIGGVLTSDNFMTATRAAVVGGTTTVVDFAMQPQNASLQKTLDEWHSKAANVSSCDYGFHLTIADWNETTFAEIPHMIRQGIPTFKVFMNEGKNHLSDRAILELLECVGNSGGMVSAHCENGGMAQYLTAKLLSEGKNGPQNHPLARPDIVEAEAVQRFLSLAELVGVPVNIVHMSTRRGMEFVEDARARKQKVFVETCPQYLVLSEECYQLPDLESAKFICAPPIRSKENQNALWQYIHNGNIDTISSDHCGFNYIADKGKSLDDFSKILNGVPGVEHRPVLVYTYGVERGRIDIQTMVRLLSENIARVFGLYPRKGVLAVGSDADVVIWDPSFRGAIRAESQLQDVDNTPYEGLPVCGRAKAVFLGGNLVAENGKMLQERLGRYVHRKLHTI